MSAERHAWLPIPVETSDQRLGLGFTFLCKLKGEQDDSTDKTTFKMTLHGKKVITMIELRSSDGIHTDWPV
jgi:hypothetical protein